MKKKRILYLIETGGPGGAERMLIELASNINKNIFCPLVCLTKKGWLFNRIEERGINSILIKSTHRFDFSWALKISDLIKSKNIDLIHTHLVDSNFYGAIASFMAKRPQIATEHGDIHHIKTRSIFFIKYFITGLIAKRIIAVSQFTAKKLKKIILNSKKISTIYNGIDTSKFELKKSEKKILLRKQLNIPIDAVVVICIANLYPAKGYEILLKAISLIYNSLPNLHLISVGRGELENKIRKYAESMRIKDRFHMLGFRNDVYDLLCMSDIFVLPSLSEALPISLLEAMASGLPVIASNVGGIPEVIEDGSSGFIVSAGDFKGLAEKIFTLARDHEMREKMGSHARKIARDSFDIKDMVSRYEKLYLEYAKKKQ